MSSPYPRDDFDAVTPPRDGRRGAHRAAPKRPGGVLAPVVIALVVVAAGGAGYVALNTVGNPGSSASAAPAASQPAAPDADASADPAPSDAAPPGPSSVSTASAGPSGPSTDAQPSAGPSAPAERSAPVVVLNGTGTSGLAAKKAKEVEADGWEVASTGNATSAQRSARTTTTVLYPAAALQGQAEALAAQMGVKAVRDAQVQAGSLTVVLR